MVINKLTESKQNFIDRMRSQEKDLQTAEQKTQAEKFMKLVKELDEEYQNGFIKIMGEKS